jgi:hypothetical protein
MPDAIDINAGQSQGSPGTENIGGEAVNEPIGGEQQAAPPGQQQETVQRIELSPDTITALAGSLRQQQSSEQSQQMTPEQLQEYLAVYNPTVEDATALGLTAEALPHLQRLLDAKVKQATRAAAIQFEYLKRSMEERLAPLQTLIQQQQQETLIKQFYTDNPDLVGKEQLVEAVYAKLGGRSWKSKEEAFKTVAENTRQLLTVLTGQANGGGNPPNGTQQMKSGVPKMSTVMTGGAGGGKQQQAGATLTPQQKLAREFFPR